MAKKPLFTHRQIDFIDAKQAGFTLVELIVVMVVVGILGAVAAPKFFEQKGFGAVAYTDQVRSLLRYGQKIAIAQNRNIYVQLDATRVLLCYDNTAACAQRVLPPSGSNSGSSATLLRCLNITAWACEGVPNGLTMTSAAPLFYFDPMGKPFNGADTPPTLASTFIAELKVTVGGDGLAHDIIIAPETGYVR